MRDKTKNRKYRIVWRVSLDEHEYIMRTVHATPGVKRVAQLERKKWLTRGWQKRLEALRQEQWSLPPDMFYPPEYKP
jgi:hypothetical protein